MLYSRLSGTIVSKCGEYEATVGYDDDRGVYELIVMSNCGTLTGCGRGKGPNRGFRLVSALRYALTAAALAGIEEVLVESADDTLTAPYAAMLARAGARAVGEAWMLRTSYGMP
jgi:hypothetical protein